MSTQQITNLAQGELASGYTAGNTTITLGSGEGALFPTSGDFTVAMNDPPDFFLKCTSRTGDVLTVTSTGQEGTTAINESSGCKVTLVVTNQVIRSLFQDYHVTDAIANRPAAGIAGRIFIPNDSVYPILRDNGSTWDYFYAGRKVTPLVSGNFSWTNQGGASVTDQTNGVSVLSTPAVNGSNSLRIRRMATPSRPYTIVMAFLARMGSGNFAEAGLIWRESGSGKLSVISIQNFSSAICSHWTNETSFNASIAAVAMAAVGPYWLKITEDSTNRTGWFSIDGITWYQIAQEGRTNFLTADQVGYYANNSNNVAQDITIIGWDQS